VVWTLYALNVKTRDLGHTAVDIDGTEEDLEVLFQRKFLAFLEMMHRLRTVLGQENQGSNRLTQV